MTESMAISQHLTTAVETAIIDDEREFEDNAGLQTDLQWTDSEHQCNLLDTGIAGIFLNISDSLDSDEEVEMHARMHEYDEESEDVQEYDEESEDVQEYDEEPELEDAHEYDEFNNTGMYAGLN